MTENHNSNEIHVTATDDKAQTFTKTLQRLFGETPVDNDYCISTLFSTYPIPFFGDIAFPIKPIASYRILKKDRNNQTYKFWQMSGVNMPKEKIFSGEKVELNRQQVRWVYMSYYGPVAIILLYALVGYLGHWIFGWNI